MRKIKEVIIGMLLVGTIFVGMGVVGGLETHYTMECKVISIEDKIVTIEDKTGECWEFASKGYTVGDKCKVTFFTNSTDKRYDDEIKKVEKIK